MAKPQLAPVVERNIKSLQDRRVADEQSADPHQRLAAWLAGVIGTMAFAYVHLAALVIWIAIQTGITSIRPFDPHFTAMIGFTSVECVFMTIFVLINQRREARAADRRAELDLQVGLLSEHEVTRLIGLLAAVANKLGMDEGKDPEIVHLSRDTTPDQVLDELEASDPDKT